MDRRTFLIHFGGLAAAPALSSLLTGCASPVREALAPPPGFDWRTLAAVQAHLLPSESSAPGAREIHAEAYLRGVLADPKLAPADRAFLIDGVESIGKLARGMTGKHFVELSHDEREAVLRGFGEMPEGERWLEEMLGYLMEALLGDPVYGGNPDGVGWQWLAHNPGFPRPPADKRYFLL
ncbi:MAG: gluconate 2-dehydrogenase subunit 3 family protein [Sulfuricaulis sp.]|nr:gluconate 2-dehydrogenase subunit 3 family protein [Sulfuricaulis sp.]